MNNIYKLKFNQQQQQLIVVSELAVGAGKNNTAGALLPDSLADWLQNGVTALKRLIGRFTLIPLGLLLSATLPALSHAADLPVGGQIAGGTGHISTSGQHMIISQQTAKLATNWQSFDIGANHSVQFIQPDSSAIALNRVTGQSASQIMGRLTANGKVFLINPNGVMVGKDAAVNTASFLASTKNLSVNDFMQGNYRLTGGSGAAAQIINQGSLTTSKGGFIVLAADKVRNEGSISTPGGTTVLAAAQQITLTLDSNGLTGVSVNGELVNALVANQGLISARDGKVYLTARGQDMLLKTVVNNSGIIDASSMSVRNGVVHLDGGSSGVVSQAGSLLANSASGKGGNIAVAGQFIRLASGSRTEAQGATGGGEVLIGGGWQGKDRRIRNAEKLIMDNAASIDVSATNQGHGGTAVLWSEQYSHFQGNISARGGAQAGNGGQVETSSRGNLQAFGTVDNTAARGKSGNWLLDPHDVTLGDGASLRGINTDSLVAGTTRFAASADNAYIDVNTITRALNLGSNVTIKTADDSASASRTSLVSGNITIADGTTIAKTAGDSATLSLIAHQHIIIGNHVNILGADHGLSVSLNASQHALLSSADTVAPISTSPINRCTGSITLGKKVNIQLGTGNFSANAAGNITAHSGQIQANTIALALGNDHTSGGTITNAHLSLQALNNLTINGNFTTTTSAGQSTIYRAGNTLAIGTEYSISRRQAGTLTTSYDPANAGGRVEFQGGTGGIIINAKSIDIKSSDNHDANLSKLISKADIRLKTDSLSLKQIKAEASGDIIMTQAESLTAFPASAEASDMSSAILALSNMTSAANIHLNMRKITLTDSQLTATQDISLTNTQQVMLSQSALTGANIRADIQTRQLTAAWTQQSSTLHATLGNISIKNKLTSSLTRVNEKGDLGYKTYGAKFNAGNTLSAEHGKIDIDIIARRDKAGSNYTDTALSITAGNEFIAETISLKGHIKGPISGAGLKIDSGDKTKPVIIHATTGNVELTGIGDANDSMSVTDNIAGCEKCGVEGVWLHNASISAAGNLIISGTTVNLHDREAEHIDDSNPAGSGISIDGVTLNASKVSIHGNTTNNSIAADSNASFNETDEKIQATREKITTGSSEIARQTLKITAEQHNIIAAEAGIALFDSKIAETQEQQNQQNHKKIQLEKLLIDQQNRLTEINKNLLGDETKLRKLRERLAKADRPGGMLFNTFDIKRQIANIENGLTYLEKIAKRSELKTEIINTQNSIDQQTLLLHQLNNEITRLHGLKNHESQLKALAESNKTHAENLKTMANQYITTLTLQLSALQAAKHAAEKRNAAASLPVTDPSSKILKNSYGFNLANISWQGGLTNSDNISLSSAGSDGNVATNTIAAGALSDAQYKVILPKGIENNTYVWLSDLQPAAQGNWTADYTPVAKTGKWIVRNAMQTGENAYNGEIHVAGLTFRNTQISNNHNITLGNSSLEHGSILTSSQNITLHQLTVSNHSRITGANISVTDSTISQSALTADHEISAHDVDIAAGSLTSKTGDIYFTGTKSVNLHGADGSNTDGVKINAAKDIHIHLQQTASSISALTIADNTSLTAINNINITVNGNKSVANPHASFYITSADFNAKNIDINITSAGMVAGAMKIDGASAFNGKLTLNATTAKGASFVNDETGQKNLLTVTERGSLTLTGAEKNTITASTTAGRAIFVNGVLHSPANLLINGSSASGEGISVGSSGNIQTSISADISSDISPRLTLTGHASSGTGVVIASHHLLANINVTGSSETGKGLELNGSAVQISNSTLTGKSHSGDGVLLKGVITGTQTNKPQIFGIATSGAGVTFANAAVSNVLVAGTAESATGVLFTGINTLSHSPVSATAATGTGLKTEAGGTLTGDKENSLITAKTTTVNASGTAASLSGNLINVSIFIADDSKASTGIQLKKAALSNSTLTASTPTSSTLISSTLTSSTLTTSTLISSTTDGSALEVSGGSSSLDNASTIKTTSQGSGTGLVVAPDGSLILADDSTVTSNAANSAGIGARIAGTLQGGTLISHHAGGSSKTPQQGGGVAIKVQGGTLINSQLDASSAGGSEHDRALYFAGGISPSTVTNSGIHANIQGQGSAMESAADSAINISGSKTITGIATGGGVGATIGGRISGGKIHGQSANNIGLSFTDGVWLENGNHSGESGATNKPGAAFAGSSTLINTTINGLNTGGGSAVEINTGASGRLTADKRSFIIGGDKSRPDSSGGVGISIAGNVKGGQLKGYSSADDGVKTTEKTWLTSTNVTGTSDSTDKGKSGIHFSKQVTLTDSYGKGSNSGAGKGVLADRQINLLRSHLEGLSEADSGIKIGGNLDMKKGSHLSGTSNGGSDPGLHIGAKVTGDDYQDGSSLDKDVTSESSGRNRLIGITHSGNTAAGTAIDGDSNGVNVFGDSAADHDIQLGANACNGVFKGASDYSSTADKDNVHFVTTGDKLKVINVHLPGKTNLSPPASDSVPAADLDSMPEGGDSPDTGSMPGADDVPKGSFRSSLHTDLFIILGGEAGGMPGGGISGGDISDSGISDSGIAGGDLPGGNSATATAGAGASPLSRSAIGGIAIAVPAIGADRLADTGAGATDASASSLPGTDAGLASDGISDGTAVVPVDITDASFRSSSGADPFIVLGGEAGGDSISGGGISGDGISGYDISGGDLPGNSSAIGTAGASPLSRSAIGGIAIAVPAIGADRLADTGAGATDASASGLPGNNASLASGSINNGFAIAGDLSKKWNTESHLLEDNEKSEIVEIRICHDSGNCESEYLDSKHPIWLSKPES